MNHNLSQQVRSILEVHVVKKQITLPDVRRACATVDVSFQQCPLSYWLQECVSGGVSYFWSDSGSSIDPIAEQKS